MQQYLLANYFEPTRPEFLDPQQLCLPLGAVRQVTWHDIHLLQYDGYVVFEHEGGHVYQIIPLDGRPHVGEKIKLWMGDSRGHWEGDTLVVDVADFNDQTWLDAAGDYHSDALHVVERYQRTGPKALTYEATIDDPKVFTQPWKIRVPLELNTEKNARLMEYECR
jgi:hypothetical protein